MAILHLRPLIFAALMLASAAPAWAWTDNPLQAGVTRVRAVHLIEIGETARTKLASCGIIGPPAPAPGSTIRAVDINAARASVSALYAGFGVGAPAYTDAPVIDAGAKVRVVYVTELRAAVDAAMGWACPVAACTSDGSCSAADPACGTTTTGADNCGGACTKTGPACACVSDGSCSAAVPACGTSTTGTDNCGAVCTRTGAVCPCVPDCSAAGSYFRCQSFSDGCGGTCMGSRRCQCVSVWDRNRFVCFSPGGDFCGAAGVICGDPEGCVCGF